MTGPGHVMILASAGSGKTFALTNRFVRLLALGARPERIAALTFTRKAAGEFFDEILKKLAKAASDSASAARLARAIDCPGLTERDFLGLLRSVVDAMPRLQLGTLDGFFARIATNFPFELGLAGGFEILEANSARMERMRVMRGLFTRNGELDEAQREFIEAFKRATFGTEEKRLGSLLESYLDEHYEIFLDAPRGDLWGNPRRIWPRGNAWLAAAPRLDQAVLALARGVAGLDLGEKQRARWEAFFSDLSAWSPGAEQGRGMTYILDNALDAWPELAEIVVERKKLSLPGPVAEALRETVAAIAGAEFERHLEKTRGIHAVLESYDASYRDLVRRAGRLTFGDVQRLLQPRPDGALPMSGEAFDDGRLFIDYRLDGGTDHWLLDEFQDTSFGQWSVLRSLIDEVVQDPSGARTFFYVGDVKQSIFAWREGDPRLFREIYDRYNAAGPGVIEERHLVNSWRSGPAVIATVNRVFGDAAVFSELFPGRASETWNREWRAHETAKPDLRDHAAWLHGAEIEDRFAIVRELIGEIGPMGRGLTCAVLVQKNSTASELADYLRREGGIPAVAESDLRVCVDNPQGRALLALARAAAHPGDRFALEHVRMTPFGEALRAEGIHTTDMLVGRILAEVHAHGFERWAARWSGLAEGWLEDGDLFSRERARQFVEAAGLFDATGSRDVAEFVRFMERHAVRETEAAGAVRVMTIHKSKGLGFDVVILPDLEGNRLDLRRQGLAVSKTPDREVEWVLDLPRKAWAERDPVLGDHLRSAEADACYEALSLLYVAMTRAKRAMYLVTKAPGKSSSRNYTKILAETLVEPCETVRVGRREFAGSYEAGDANWHAETEAVPAAARPGPIITVDASRFEHRPGRAARRASAGKGGELSGTQLFDMEAGSAAEFGTVMHRLLAEVRWLDEKTSREWALDWRKRGEPEVAIAEAVACLESPELAEIWRGGEGCEVWRERAFEVILENHWITGIFDRVVLSRDADGLPSRVTVFDFKTDFVSEAKQIERAVERHRGQMELYRRVAARLTGVEERLVEAMLVFTKLRSKNLV